MALLLRKHRIPLGIYIHVPFCRSKCEYCDFYSLTSKEPQLWEDYLNAMCTHIKEAGRQAPSYVVDTIYFGGGTPTYFGADGMTTILNAVRKNFRVSSRAEISFEANPDSVNDKLLRKLKAEGFNRVSLGVQCDDDKILKRIGRPHTYAQAKNAVARIRKHGFKNLSLDLIYGLPGQSLEGWKSTLENVLKLEPEHMSCYGLKVEPGTPLYEYQDCCNLADDDTQADMYLAAIDILQEHGFHQYEISNFCRKGKVSRHNLKYWTGEEYLGFGPDASSDFGGRRFAIVRDLRQYIDGINNGGQVLRESQNIGTGERAGEYLIMRLRTVAGVDPKEYEKKFMMPFAPLEKELIRCQKNNLAARGYDGSWHLTPKGFLVSNSIMSDLLLIQEKS